MALVSIAHRVTGVLLYLSIPCLLYLLHLLLQGHFDTLNQCMQAWSMRLFLFATISALFFHVIAGVRHMISDAGWGHSLSASYMISYGIFAVAIVFEVFLLSVFVR